MARNQQVKDIVKQYSDVVDFDFLNQIMSQSKELQDFEMNKTTLLNISEWALNGKSDEDIRKSLDLRPKQWATLLSICPVLILVMKDSRALADVVVAGSLFQTAIGGKRIKKQIAKSVKEYEYDEKTGKNYVVGEHLETIEVWEEMPPNAYLLKFLAEHKLSEKFGGKPVDNNQEYSKILDSLTPEQLAIIEMEKGRGLDDKE